jgi:hypothetical protein
MIETVCRQIVTLFSSLHADLATVKTTSIEKALNFKNDNQNG